MKNWYFWENGGYKGVLYGSFRRTNSRIEYEYEEFFSRSGREGSKVSIYHSKKNKDSFHPEIFRVATIEEVNAFKFLWIAAQIEGYEVEVESGFDDEIIGIDSFTFEKISTL